jgi:hypothetical protein
MAFTLDIVLLSSFNSSQFLVYQTLRAFLSLLSLSMFPYLEALSHIYAGRARIAFGHMRRQIPKNLPQSSSDEIKKIIDNLIVFFDQYQHLKL